MNKKQLESFMADGNLDLTSVMEKINANRCGVLFIVNENGQLKGAISDGDIRRWLIKGGSLQTKSFLVMNKTPRYIFKKDQSHARRYMKQELIRVVPVVEADMSIVDIEILDKETYLKSERRFIDAPVIIMAGGKGTRLYPFTKILPKPLIPIGDIPIIERIINVFCEYGMKDYYVTVNYKKNMIKSYFSELDVDYRVVYVEEDKPLGTAGSIRLIQETFDKPMFITNCDVIIKADYSEIYHYHIQNKNAITIVAAAKNDTIPYGVIHSKDTGEVVSMEEKPSRAYLVNTGMYVVNPEMTELIPKDKFYHMTDLTNAALKAGFKVAVYQVAEDDFLDMGEFEEMKRMEEKLNV